MGNVTLERGSWMVIFVSSTWMVVIQMTLSSSSFWAEVMLAVVIQMSPSSSSFWVAVILVVVTQMSPSSFST